MIPYPKTHSWEASLKLPRDQRAVWRHWWRVLTYVILPWVVGLTAIAAAWLSGRSWMNGSPLDVVIMAASGLAGFGLLWASWLFIRAGYLRLPYFETAAPDLFTAYEESVHSAARSAEPPVSRSRAGVTGPSKKG